VERLGNNGVKISTQGRPPGREKSVKPQSFAIGGLARPVQGAIWPIARISRTGMRARRASERAGNETLPAFKTGRPLGTNVLADCWESQMVRKLRLQKPGSCSETHMSTLLMQEG